MHTWFRHLIGMIDGPNRRLPVTRHPYAITPDPNEWLWFTESTANRIGDISASVTEFVIPMANSQPHRITKGPDGNLWFTESNTNTIGRMTPGGAFTEWTIPFIGAAPETDEWISRSVEGGPPPRRGPPFSRK